MSRWRNHQSKRAEKPHSKSSARKTLDGPATRPMTPLAVENSVGKPAAPREGARLMSARERELGELPSPDLSLLGRKAGRGLFVLENRFRTLNALVPHLQEFSYPSRDARKPEERRGIGRWWQDDVVLEMR